ncbi:MAG: thiol oxidoreductase [Myxococcales bacterium]|nr:thiol oxidoreductase [Myxococcales bacterium]MCB9519747.1 thiol oxidoreductase [Myxococcales bacterium]MCB9530438.1 thiol oxidoreductase [Myxococcales bacterium]MCB9533686.1 thiol oxidoreductase [Myxococcales bacterium]
MSAAATGTQFGRRALAATLLVAAAGPLVACDDAPAEAAAPRAGGDTTVDERSSHAFSLPAPNLSADDLEQHLAGDVTFEAIFVPAPADINPGLGPVFNAPACGACHARDGRGMPVAGTPSGASPLLVRVSDLALPRGPHGEPPPADGLGGQLQDRANFGVEPEIAIAIDWIESTGQFDDGTAYTLREPSFDITRPDGTSLPAGLVFSPRVAPPVFGLGLLEAVAEADIVALADPDDADGDGISGRANRVWSPTLQAMSLGRFGWKANTANLTDQAAAAYFNDMGVSSPVFPEPDGSHEIDQETLDATVHYTQTLAVPARAQADAQVRRGEALFARLDCEGCHTSTLRTASDHPVAALRDQQIHPYTDLLLHDMGPDLADGRPDYEADGREWRTPALWGIGLTQTVLPYASFLHDGRARTLEEAILWHGGEAEASRDGYRGLSATDRAAVLAFLRSL